jgi:hypothetical protein
MAFLLDTSILVRLANVNNVRHPIAARAVLELHRRNEVLHIGGVKGTYKFIAVGAFNETACVS